jgi:hypothetical protein
MVPIHKIVDIRPIPTNKIGKFLAV